MSDRKPGGVSRRRLMGGLGAAGALASAPILTPASAQRRPPQQGGNAYEANFRTWAERNGIGSAVCVVRRGDQQVAAAAVGRLTPASVVPVQSLSKAVTGAAIATLIGDGRLRLDTPVGEALGRFFQRTRPPADQRFASVTIAQLLTQRSGLPGDGDQGGFYGDQLTGMLQRTPPAELDLAELLAGMLGRARLVRAPGAQYAYSNVNYIALGMVVQEASGQPYPAYAQARVFRPLGIDSARIGRNVYLGASSGGWEMTGADYLRFHRAFASGGLVPAGVRQWMNNPEGKGAGEGSWYALGSTLRRNGQGFNHWHFGSWDWNQANARGGAIRASEASYVCSVPDGTSWFVAWAPNKEGVGNRIDGRMWAAHDGNG